VSLRFVKNKELIAAKVKMDKRIAIIGMKFFSSFIIYSAAINKIVNPIKASIINVLGTTILRATNASVILCPRVNPVMTINKCLKFIHKYYQAH
jgi:hypothetical protein